MRNYTRQLGLLLLAVTLPWLTATAAPVTVPDKLPTIADGALQPEVHYSDVAMLVRHWIGRFHYLRPEFDEALSERVFHRYIEMLDPNRSHFLASDIEEFGAYRRTLVHPRRAADLKQAYEIYHRFHERYHERIDYLLAQLEREHDFTLDETYRFDRSEQPWARDSEELDDITRRRFKHDALTLLLTGQEREVVVETLERRYRGMARRIDQTNTNDVFQVFMNAVTTSVDPNTAYMTPRVQENFHIDMSLKLEGIGAVLQADDDYTRVVSIVPAGPADRSNELFPDDRIIGISQGDDEDFVDVVGWRVDDVVRLIRGPQDTVVRLRVLPATAPPDAAPQTVRLVRKEIRLEEQAAKKSLIDVPDGDQALRIGVIDIPTFYADFSAQQAGDAEARSTTRDVRRLLSELKREAVDAVIIDLRGNGGGSLQEATDLAALFLGDGPVVQIRSGDGAVQVSHNRGNSDAEYDGPMAVMVDRQSASGSEIFAGVIQDYGRGLVIGDRTFGKGTVQQLVPLDRYWRGGDQKLGELRLTIAKFYRVSGGSNQHRGIIPDIALPSQFPDNGWGESERPNALPWDEIPPTDYTVKAVLDKAAPLLRELHQRRVLDNARFDIFTDEIESATRARNRTTVSLNRETRVRENAELDKARLARENARRDLLGLAPLDSLEDLERDREREDLLLKEAAHILADFTDYSRRHGVVSNWPTSARGG